MILLSHDQTGVGTPSTPKPILFTLEGRFKKVPITHVSIARTDVRGPSSCKQTPHQFVSIHRSVRSSAAQGCRSRNAGRSHQTPSRDAEAARFDVTLSTPAKITHGAQASISTGCLQRLSNARDRTQESTFLRLVFRWSSLIGCNLNVLEAEFAARQQNTV